MTDEYFIDYSYNFLELKTDACMAFDIILEIHCFQSIIPECSCISEAFGSTLTSVSFLLLSSSYFWWIFCLTKSPTRRIFEHLLLTIFKVTLHYYPREVSDNNDI